MSQECDEVLELVISLDREDRCVGVNLNGDIPPTHRVRVVTVKRKGRSEIERKVIVEC